MHFDAYTNDAICSAMGLGKFEDIETPSLRLMLLPSFDPEVCFTLTGKRLSIIAFEKHLWAEAFVHPLPKQIEGVDVDPSLFEQMAKLMPAAIEQSEDQKKWAYLDGMPASAILKLKSGLQRLAKQDRMTTRNGS